MHRSEGGRGLAGIKRDAAPLQRHPTGRRSANDVSIPERRTKPHDAAEDISADYLTIFACEMVAELRKGYFYFYISVPDNGALKSLLFRSSSSVSGLLRSFISPEIFFPTKSMCSLNFVSMKL